MVGAMLSILIVIVLPVAVLSSVLPAVSTLQKAMVWVPARLWLKEPA